MASTTEDKPSFMLFSRVTAPVRNTLMWIKDTTGLPWWATIALSAVFVRGSMTPLTLLNMKRMQRVQGAYPEIKQLFDAYAQRVRIPHLTGTERLDTLKTLVKASHLSFLRRGQTIKGLFAVPLTNVSIFVYFAMGVRDMLHTYPEIFSKEAFAFVPSLLSTDSLFVLPVVAVSSSYLLLELSMGRSAGSPFLFRLKDVVQTALIYGFPISCMLPAGVFAYWLPSVWFSMVTIKLLRSRGVRDYMVRSSFKDMKVNLQKAIKKLKDT